MAKALKSRPKKKLAKYRSMRNFKRTAEPKGGKTTASGDSFVIQKHHARNLHYDFRLELDGVLLSWAVPKGPSLKVGERRLAMRTEDHPLEYGGFEGIIPKGEYGGGTVIVWDRGRWAPIGDPRAGLKKGHLEFTLQGVKLAGRWHLVRTKGVGSKESWLLFKARDAAASDVDIVENEPDSVLAKQATRVWFPKSMPLSNPNKVLYEESGVTKQTLALYYMTVADHILPLIGNRPLSLVRCPNGWNKQCFFQKHAKQIPETIGRVQVQEDGGELAEHTYVHDLKGLIAMVQLGVLELHTWGCHVRDVDKPDQLVFDLDPDEALPWKRVAEGAFEVRDFLDGLGLKSFLKTTGGKGLHVVVPVERRLDWDAFKAFSKHVVEAIAEKNPERYVTNMAKRLRTGKIFLDYLRNGRGATAIGAYSTRARAGATVSTPITWDELKKGVDPHDFTVLTVPMRVQKKSPWAGYDDVKQSITAAMRKKVA